MIRHLMKEAIMVIRGCLVAVAVLGGCASVPVGNSAAEAMAHVQLETTEGCECVAPCPCDSLEPASFDGCRALKFYHVHSGVVDGQDLAGMTFVAVIARSPKLMFHLRDWHGALYVPRSATPAQQAALRRVADAIWGGVYRGFEARQAELTYEAEGESRRATIGRIGHLVTAPLTGPDGQVKRFPKDPISKSGVALRNHFDDGTIRWDLSGRNARVAPVTIKLPGANPPAAASRPVQ
jgi:hypothetical protein